MDTRIKKIIAELIKQNVIAAQPSRCKKLSGGTVSELYLLKVDDSEYVLKLNGPEVTEPEALFLDTYKEVGLLPKLHYLDPSKTFIVYSFISGSTDYTGSSKKKVLKELADGLINQYEKAAPESGWGWVDSPSASWQEFLRNEVSHAKESIGSSLGPADHQFIAGLVEKVGVKTEAYLLHGDCGFHNFIFNEGQLTGIIDPAPVIGFPIYDLVYAFCSTPEDLTKETFDYAARFLRERPSANYDLVLIGLYLRIALCGKHHPEDLALYLKAWSEWLKITGYATKP
ncbi:aminoglycoside phosphotransferase family protein [Planomicrobium okeanokoites]|uniref:aminoglycoside phosphotransferase family protein n=1 Tax=Planomicrobium okeanokoites TaxID=244 RepID=UPI00356284C5